MNSIGNPLNSFFSWYIKKRIEEIDKFIQFPILSQKTTLLELINLSKKTIFGVKNNFSSINSESAYKNQVPLSRYLEFAPFIKRQKQGEPNVLWPGKVKWFAQSSGTTCGTIKHIPITNESLKKCHYKGGKDLLSLYYHNNPNTQLFKGKHLIIGGSTQKFSSDSQIKIGDLSAIIMENLPWWCEWRRSPKKVNELIEKKWEQKIHYIIENSSKDDVRILAGTPSWVLVIINQLLKENEISSIHDIWPNLELYLHGGLNIEPYKDRFLKLFKKNINFYQNYNATEGFFGLQHKNDDDDMLLMLDYGIYYEFIPKKNWQEDQPKTLCLEEIELLKPYEVVISTNGGLWRYRLEDTVEFTSKNPFKIKVVGRTQQFINIAGEEVMIQHIEKALEKASKRCNCSISDFIVSPVFEEKEKSIGHHLWIIEFIKIPKNIINFNDILDGELQKINIDYKAKRKNNSPLKQLSVKPVKKKTFYKWLKSHDKLSGQSKIPRINNDFKIIHELLQVDHNY